MSNQSVHITQGEQAIGDDQDMVISTLLGSCVSCCLWDPEAGVGGMNHMLLTSSASKTGACNLAGVNAMELLINGILKCGGQRDRLRAKAFGGARMISGLSDIGKQNSEFILHFLDQENIVCEGHSLGGETARQLKFWPSSGKVMLKVRGDAAIETLTRIDVTPDTGNEMELFS